MPIKIAERAVFVLSVKNDTFANVGLFLMARLFNGLSEAVGTKATLIQQTDTKIVFEECEPLAWRTMHPVHEGWQAPSVVPEGLTSEESDPSRFSLFPERAVFTLSILNDEFSDMDLLVFSRIMAGMSKAIGPKAKCLNYSASEIVFEEETAGSWRKPPIGKTHTISANYDVDDIDLLEDDEVLEEVMFIMRKNALPSNDDHALFSDWSRGSLETLLRLIKKESKSD